MSYYCYCSTVLHNTSIHPVTIYIFRQACQLIFCKYYLNNVVRPMILLHSIQIFEDTKGVFRSRKSKKDRPTIQWTKEKDKQWSTKHYTENWRWSNTNAINNHGWTHLLWDGKQFLLQILLNNINNIHIMW